MTPCQLLWVVRVDPGRDRVYRDNHIKVDTSFMLLIVTFYSMVKCRGCLSCFSRAAEFQYFINIVHLST